MLAGVLMVGAALLGAAAALSADSSATHTVTVRVAPVSAVEVTGGDLELAIGQGEPSTGPATASDATTCDLHWVTNQTNQKITVATDLASPRFALRVEAFNATGGRPAGAVALNTTSQDFVVDISRGTGKCDLCYTATAVELVELASDVHTVIYTITDAQ